MRRSLWPYVFIAPFLLGFLAFGVFPIAFSLWLSFTDWNGIAAPAWRGLANFRDAFGPSGRAFRDSMLNSALIALLYVPVVTVLSLVVAMFLNDPRVRGFTAFRAMIFAPFVTSMIAAGMVFQLLLGPQGLVNGLLRAVGLEGLPWLDDPGLARVSLLFLLVWGNLGYNVVIMLAGLQAIPGEVVDAARVDGAGWWARLLLVILPMMRPVVLFSTVFSVAGCFALFNEVVALGRGPLDSNVTPLVVIYDTAFSSGLFGLASAQSYLYFLVILGLTVVQFRLIGRERV